MRLTSLISILSSAIFLAALVLPSAAQAPNDIRIALIIGNAAYPGNMALANPSNDAKDMAATLRNMGFGVIEVLDGNRVQMMNAIERANKQLTGKQGVGMLFYAGHGLQLDWRNYMVPVDAKLSSAADVPKQTVDIELVMKSFQQAGNRMNIVVLDACRDDPFASQSTNGKTSSGKGLAPLDAPTGTFLAYATAPGNVAQDGTGKNGLYTGFLLQELQKPTARIEDVFKRVRFAVRKASNGAQIPWETTSLEDDFVFNSGVKKIILQPPNEVEKTQANAPVSQPVAVVEKPAATSPPILLLPDLVIAPIQLKPVSRMNKDEKDKQFDLEKAEWNKIKESTTVDPFYAFILKYPNGLLSSAVANAIERLDAAKTLSFTDKLGQPAGLSFNKLQVIGDTVKYARFDGYNGAELGTHELTVMNTNKGIITYNNGVVITAQGETLVDDRGTRYDPPRAERPTEGLFVGKKWDARSDSVLGAGWGRHSGWRGPTSVVGRVVAFEDIKTRAGIFKAHKIEVRYLVPNYTINLTYWIDSSTGLTVKKIFAGRPIWGNPDLWSEEAVSIARNTG